MTADMMIICKEQDIESAIFVDETTMGEPTTEFGRWFQSRFCGAPSTAEQVFGNGEHKFTLVTTADIAGVKAALKKMTCHPSLDKEAALAYMKAHVGLHISTENW